MKNVNTLLVCRPVDEEQKRKLRSALPETEIIYREFQETPGEEKSRVEVILGNTPPSSLKECPRLQWVQLASAGSDSYMGYMPEGVVLTNATGAYGEHISEHMLGALISLRHFFPKYYDNQKSGVWRFEGVAKNLCGSTCVVLGMGDIGGCFARKMKAMGAYVIGVRRTDSRKPDYCDELYLTQELDKVLPRADVVAMALPNSPQTTGILSAERIAAMKPGAYVINVGRGTAVDQSALCDALNSGHLGGACVDVTTPEPLPADHPLWQAKNILITPHIAGGKLIGAPSELGLELFLENLKAWQNEKPLRNVVDMVSGYRKLEE